MAWAAMAVLVCSLVWGTMGDASADAKLWAWIIGSSAVMALAAFGGHTRAEGKLTREAVLASEERVLSAVLGVELRLRSELAAHDANVERWWAEAHEQIGRIVAQGEIAPILVTKINQAVEESRKAQAAATAYVDSGVAKLFAEIKGLRQDIETSVEMRASIEQLREEIAAIPRQSAADLDSLVEHHLSKMLEDAAAQSENVADMEALRHLRQVQRRLEDHRSEA
jgi:hypothetical protein